MSFATLPQLNGRLFLSDGGMETSLIYHEGVDLPQFAAFILLRDSIGRRRLAGHFRLSLELAAETPHAGFGLVYRLDAATELDIGDPEELGNSYRRLKALLPALNVLGGCCGTDLRHLRAIRDAWIGTVA